VISVAVVSTRRLGLGREIWLSVSSTLLLLSIPKLGISDCGHLAISGCGHLGRKMLLEGMCCREVCSLAGTSKRTINATLLMEEGNGALTIALGNCCLSAGHVGNPVRWRQLDTQIAEDGKKTLPTRQQELKGKCSNKIFSKILYKLQCASPVDFYLEVSLCAFSTLTTIAILADFYVSKTYSMFVR